MGLLIDNDHKPLVNNNSQLDNESGYASQGADQDLRLSV
jgi:hypothetical protein